MLTGNGDYYSSGNDLSVFMQTDLSDENAKNKAFEDAKTLLLNFVNAFIRFPKVFASQDLDLILDFNCGSQWSCYWYCSYNTCSLRFCFRR